MVRLARRLWECPTIRARWQHTDLGAQFTDVPGGTAHWVFTGGNNYNDQSGDAAIVINQAPSFTTTVGDGPFTYDTTTHAGGSGTVTGVNLNTTATSLTYTGDQVDAGTYYVTAHYAGDQNHTASDGSPVGIVINQADQTITWSNPKNIVYGTALSGTQLNAAVAGVPGGNDPGVLSYTPPAGTILGGGLNQPLTVNAAATSNYNPATQTVYINVTQASTTTSVSTSSSSLVYGQLVTFTAHVSTLVVGAGIASPSGMVNFLDGTTVVGNGTVSGGVATYTTTTLQVGSQSITARYVGDTNFSGSTSSAIADTVNKNSTTTFVTTTVNPSVFTQSVTFSATISPGFPGTQVPVDGTVITFKDGAAVLGTGSLSGGVATITTTALTVKTHSITAVFAGDGSFLASTSPVLSQTVTTDNTTTAVTSSVTPSVFGQSVIFTATVSAASPGTGTPTGPAGTVTFYDGATSLGNGTLSGGVASITKSLAVGGHAITAVYNGNANYITSTSAVMTQTVNQDATTSVVTSSVNPSVTGQAVTFTVTVSAASPGSGTPSGMVTFMDGGTALGAAVTLNASGKATLKVALPSAGSHSITVAYAGDTNFVGDTSSTLTQTVNPDATTTARATSFNPSVFGQTVTFTATVSASSPGSGTPTGLVTFIDGATAIGTGMLDGSGVATFSTSALSVSTHVIYVVYAGDANYTTSTSTSISQKVNQASSTTAVVSSANPSTFGQSVTFTATVSAVLPGSGTPTGTATFKDGTKVLGAGTLDGTGTVSFTTSSLALGSHSITVVYGGDSNFKTSTSAVLTQTVNSAAAGSINIGTSIAPAQSADVTALDLLLSDLSWMNSKTTKKL